MWLREYPCRLLKDPLGAVPILVPFLAGLVLCAALLFLLYLRDCPANRRKLVLRWAN